MGGQENLFGFSFGYRKTLLVIIICELGVTCVMSIKTLSTCCYCCHLQVVDIMRVNVDKVLERDQKLSELDDRAGKMHVSPAGLI